MCFARFVFRIGLDATKEKKRDETALLEAKLQESCSADLDKPLPGGFGESLGV